MRAVAHAVTLTHEVAAIDGTRTTELPAGVLDSLPGMLGRIAPLFDVYRRGVVILSGPAAQRLGWPPELPRSPKDAKEHPILTAPRAAGWRVSGLSGWQTFWGVDGRPSVHVAVHPWLTKGQTGPLLDPDPLEMSWHCYRWAGLTGSAYHASPGVTGIGLLRDGWRGRDTPYWTPPHSRLPAGTRQAEADIIWTAPENRRPTGAYQHRYDANLMYLGASGSAVLAVSELHHTPKARPAKDIAGYWRIERPSWHEPRLPSPLGWRRQIRRDEPLWVTTPTILLLQELAEQNAGPDPVILDAWTAPGYRVMRSWYQTLTRAVGTARESADPYDARQLYALKACYRETVGMLGHEKARVHRPDWRHAVIATARASLWRKLWRVAMVENRWPAAVEVDCVTYMADIRDPISACPSGIAVGTGAGAFKVERTEQVR